MRKPTISKSTWRVVLIIGLFGLMVYGVVVYYRHQIKKMEDRMEGAPSRLQND